MHLAMPHPDVGLTVFDQQPGLGNQPHKQAALEDDQDDRKHHADQRSQQLGEPGLKDDEDKDLVLRTT